MMDVNNANEADDVKLWGGSPWISIWIRPRDTIRWIVNTDPEDKVLLLAMLSGMAGMLGSAIARSLGDSFSFVVVFLIIVIGGPLGGLLGLYISGAILKWSGSVLGGQASMIEVRAAIAWSLVPQIFGVLLNIPLLLIFRQEAFTTLTPNTDAILIAYPLLDILVILVLFGVLLLSIILSIWYIIIYLKCIGEVHQFSAWRALGAVLLPSAILLVPIFLCILPLILLA